MDYLAERAVLVVHGMMMVEREQPIRRDHRPALKRVCVDMECPDGAKVMHGGRVYHFCCFKFFYLKIYCNKKQIKKVDAKSFITILIFHY